MAGAVPRPVGSASARKEGAQQVTTEKPALTSALIVVIMAQVQKAKLVWVARARGTLRAMTPVWSLAPERQVRHDFKNGFAAMRQ